MLFVVVNGPPGSGKSTLATRLAMELDWPLIAKDDIKEALGDALDVGGQEWTQRLSAASFEVMWAVAARAPHAVLEGNFYPSAATRLRALDQAVLEVFCRCPLQVCRDRFERRLRDDNRHRVHPRTFHRWSSSNSSPSRSESVLSSRSAPRVTLMSRESSNGSTRAAERCGSGRSQAALFS
jgi:predicted kinase